MEKLIERILDFLGPKFVGAAVISIPVLVLASFITLGVAAYRDQPFSFFGLQLGPSGPRNVDHGAIAPPVGSIIPYFGNPTDLPANWRICDNSILNDSRSIRFNGKRLPDLSDDRFLMGVSVETHEKLVTIRGGRNEIPSESHSHTGTAESNITHMDWAPGQQFQREGEQTQRHTHPVVILKSGSHNHDGENRPKYQGVIYIIRIW